MRNVAYIVHTFDKAGLERCVAHLVNHLDRSRFMPMVICLNRTGSAAQWIERPDVPVIELRKSPLHGWRAVWGFAKVLRDARIDIVHSHNWGTLAETAAARYLAGTAIHLHAERGTIMGGPANGGRLRQAIRGRAMRSMLYRCEAVIAVAHSVRERLTHATGFPQDRVRIVPNGVAAPNSDNAEEARRSIRRRLGIPEEAVVVGSVGRLQPVKNFGLLVAAVGAAQNAGCPVWGLLIGDGPERNSLEARAGSQMTSFPFHFAGEQSQIADWLAAIDVYVNCSLSEGMSQSVLEAMACGKPLVVTDVGDNRILAGGDPGCGLIIPSNDREALAAALIRLSESPAERQALGARARERFETQYTLETMIHRYEQLYEELAGSTGDQPAIASMTAAAE